MSKKVVQICSRTVNIVKEEARPVVSFCIAAASIPVEVLKRQKKEITIQEIKRVAKHFGWAVKDVKP